MLIYHGVYMAKTTKSIENDVYRGFYDDLVESISRDNSEYKYLLKHCPSFFRLLCNILIDLRTDWHSKMMINSALAYFVLPYDIIPDDEYGAKGYLDDLFLCAYVLKELSETEDPQIILDNWSGEEDILKLIEDIYDKTLVLVGSQSSEILGLVGLKKYISLDLKDAKIAWQSRSKRISDEKKELLGILSYLVSRMYGTPRMKDADRIIEFFRNHPDFEEVQRIIFIAKGLDIKKESENINEIERKIEKDLSDNRLKRLIDKSGD